MSAAGLSREVSLLQGRYEPLCQPLSAPKAVSGRALPRLHYLSATASPVCSRNRHQLCQRHKHSRHFSPMSGGGFRNLPRHSIGDGYRFEPARVFHYSAICVGSPPLGARRNWAASRGSPAPRIPPGRGPPSPLFRAPPRFRGRAVVATLRFFSATALGAAGWAGSLRRPASGVSARRLR